MCTVFSVAACADPAIGLPEPVAEELAFLVLSALIALLLGDGTFCDSPHDH